MTELTYTSTIGDVVSTTVAQAQLAVVTATEASEGVDVGDVTVLIPDTLQDELDVIIKDAVELCAGVAKLRKRDSKVLPEKPLFSYALLTMYFSPQA